MGIGPGRGILSPKSLNLQPLPSPNPSSLKDEVANTKFKAVKVFTRAIPGSDSSSHQDLIKVAAKIKLRSTPGIVKSPGGTPIKKRDLGGDDLASQLLKKFAAANSEPPLRRGRTSFGEKENWDDI